MRLVHGLLLYPSQSGHEYIVHFICFPKDGGKGWGVGTLKCSGFIHERLLCLLKCSEFTTLLDSAKLTTSILNTTKLLNYLQKTGVYCDVLLYT